MNMNFLHSSRSNLSARLKQGDIEAFDYLSSRITPKNSDDGILWMQKCFAKCGIAYREIKERSIQQRKKKKRQTKEKARQRFTTRFVCPFPAWVQKIRARRQEESEKSQRRMLKITNARALAP
ncbi:hypothetical protein ACS0PU_010941 [Formica fusca]